MFKGKKIIGLCLFLAALMLTGCWGDSNNDNDNAGIDSKCTIGTSKIGNCKL